jgi:hypothetical protein
MQVYRGLLQDRGKSNIIIDNSDTGPRTADEKDMADRAVRGKVRGERYNERERYFLLFGYRKLPGYGKKHS